MIRILVPILVALGCTTAGDPDIASTEGAADAAAIPSLASAKADTAGPVLPEDALPIPLHRQATEYSCGAASLLSVLWYFQVFDGGESDLYDALDTDPDYGTEPQKIRSVAASYGLRARYARDATIADLRRALASGDAVILDIQAWNSDIRTAAGWRAEDESGHYVVLVGMDDEHAFVMDPVVQAGYGYLPLEELLDRWHDCEYDRRTGESHCYDHMAIFIGGGEPLMGPPAPYRIE